MHYMTVLVVVPICCCYCLKDFSLLTIEGEQARLHPFNGRSYKW